MELVFTAIDDFRASDVVNQVDPLKKLLETRE